MAEQWQLTWIEEGVAAGTFIAHAFLRKKARTRTGMKLVASLDLYGLPSEEVALTEMRRRVELMGGVLVDARSE